MSAYTQDSKNKSSADTVNSIMRFKLYGFFILGFIVILLLSYFLKAKP